MHLLLWGEDHLLLSLHLTVVCGFCILCIDYHQSNEESLWLIVDGRVYDVTSFISDHPGGSVGR